MGTQTHRSKLAQEKHKVNKREAELQIEIVSSRQNSRYFNVAFFSFALTECDLLILSSVISL